MGNTHKFGTFGERGVQVHSTRSMTLKAKVGEVAVELRGGSSVRALHNNSKGKTRGREN